jgi:hypothetical protein
MPLPRCCGTATTNMCVFVSRSLGMWFKFWYAPVAQLVEHIHGKDEVSGSIPLGGSTKKWVIGNS